MNSLTHKITRAHLKTIAVITMTLDHFGAIIIETLMNRTPGDQQLVMLYVLLRIIGRIAFPLYAYLLAEGITHTHNRIAYLLRIGAFALISEIPFDIGLSLSKVNLRNGHFFELSYQNVFFTLFLGFAVMCLIEHLYETCKPNHPLLQLCGLIAALIASYIGEFIHCDYGAEGVFAVYA
ncbi:MAG: conjugal transfer protein TraX, partial [Lachnospiraceae bacterium]|nr:conjugal transfer protein TraX [Lachnospiraceae bacterium]